MIVQKVLEELQNTYPNRVIKKLPEESPTEIICEIDPTQDHEEYSNTIAIIDRSIPHYHKKAEEAYEVIRGELTVYKNDTEYKLQKGESLTIHPGEIHYAVGNETWVKVYARPGWKFDDHIVVEK